MLVLETLLLLLSLSLSLLLPCFAISSSNSTRKLPVSLRAALGRGREGSFSTNITSYLIISTINYTTTQIHTGKCSFSASLSFFIFSVHKSLPSTNASLISSGKVSVNSESLIKKSAEKKHCTGIGVNRN